MSFFGDIPHGKNDLPQLLAMKAPEFNIEDVDGAEYMLDHRMEGCFCFVCTKKIGSMENAIALLLSLIHILIFYSIGWYR